MPQLSPSALQPGNTRRRGRRGSALPPGLLPRLAAPIFCRLLISPTPSLQPIPLLLSGSWHLSQRQRFAAHLSPLRRGEQTGPPLSAHPRVGHRGGLMGGGGGRSGGAEPRSVRHGHLRPPKQSCSTEAGRATGRSVSCAVCRYWVGGGDVTNKSPRSHSIQTSEARFIARPKKSIPLNRGKRERGEGEREKDQRRGKYSEF